MVLHGHGSLLSMHRHCQCIGTLTSSEFQQAGGLHSPCYLMKHIRTSCMGWLFHPPEGPESAYRQQHNLILCMSSPHMPCHANVQMIMC